MSATVTDLFAGAGGSSTGAEQAGAEVLIAANHWRLAVDTHQANHPDTAHDCADISQVDPRRYPHTDILWASPECTHHTNASGNRRDGDLRPPSLFDQDKPLPDAAYERSRATMWDVPRFAEYHHYPVVLVENVVEATRWAPFHAWIQAMEALGYRHEIICHNSMHAQMAGLPAPQSRDRLYVAFWDRRMRRPDWGRVQTPTAWCPRCDRRVDAAKAWKRDGNRVGKYRSQYIYVCGTCGHDVEPGWLPAASAIDWSIPAERIGDRKRPLSPKTMARIQAGLERWHEQPVITRNATTRAGSPAYLSTPVSEPMRTILASGVPQSLLMPYYGSSVSAETVDRPMGTITTVDRYGLVMLRGHNTAKPATAPLDTIAAGGTHHAIAELDVPDIQDCRFRMLEPSEYAAGMAFPSGYLWQGTKRERVKLAGNAVTPPMARDLIKVATQALEDA